METAKAARAAKASGVTVVPSPKTRLLDQARDVIRVKHDSIRTKEADVQWIKRSIFFHGRRHPREMGEAEIEALLADWAVQRKVAASTQNQALNALVFLHQEDPHLELREFSALRAERPDWLPVILTKAERAKLLAAIKPGTIGWIARLLYSTGMRLMECVRLRVQEALFEENQIEARDGKLFRAARRRHREFRGSLSPGEPLCRRSSPESSLVGEQEA